MTSIRLFNKDYFDGLRLITSSMDKKYDEALNDLKTWTKTNDFYFIDVDDDTAGFFLASGNKVESIYVKDEYKEINILKDIKKLLKQRNKEVILV